MLRSNSCRKTIARSNARDYRVLARLVERVDISLPYTAVELNNGDFAVLCLCEHVVEALSYRSENECGAAV